jgi:hypothetical protein
MFRAPDPNPQLAAEPSRLVEVFSHTSIRVVQVRSLSPESCTPFPFESKYKY